MCAIIKVISLPMYHQMKFSFPYHSVQFSPLAALTSSSSHWSSPFLSLSLRCRSSLRRRSLPSQALHRCARSRSQQHARHAGAAAILPARSNLLPSLFLKRETPPRRSPATGHHSSISSTMSTFTPSSTIPNSRPSLSLPPASCPRAPEMATMAVRGGPPSTRSPMPGVPKAEPPHSPLSPHALGSENGGRKRCSGGAPAATHGGAA